MSKSRGDFSRWDFWWFGAAWLVIGTAELGNWRQACSACQCHLPTLRYGARSTRRYLEKKMKKRVQEGEWTRCRTSTGAGVGKWLLASLEQARPQTDTAGTEYGSVHGTAHHQPVASTIWGVRCNSDLLLMVSKMCKCQCWHSALPLYCVPRKQVTISLFLSFFLSSPLHAK